MKTLAFIVNKLSNSVRWRDQSKTNAPIYETILQSEIEEPARPSEATKVTAHKRYPSSKIKPIIKYTSNLIGKCL